MNNRLRSSIRKDSELQAKHIRKFKFRGVESTQGSPLFSHTTLYKVEGYVNNKSEITSKNRKRRMARQYSTRSKVAKMDLAEDIQQQIDDQIRMREGAMKLMSACSTLNQALETSKNLLTINGRILGLMSALQKKKQEHVLQEYNRQRSSTSTESPEDACTGKVAISDMRIPLMWRDNVHFTGKTGDQSYYAFALIRCGDEVRDTPLYEITSADTDMYFDLTIIFDDLPPDFKMDFEVYYTVITSNEAHGVRAPMRPSMKLHTQKRVVQFKAPKFCLAGHVHITIDDIRNGIISKDLTMGGKGASGVAVLGDLHEFPVHPLELWGQICCQLAAQPKDMFRDIQKGHIKIELNSPANNYHCVLRQGFIHCWEEEDHALSSKPVNSIKIHENMKVTQVQNSEISSIKLINVNAENADVITLTFHNTTECFEWKLAIKRQIANVISWKNAFTEQMRIKEMKKNRLSIPSKASFYDQILIEDITSVTHVSQSPLFGQGIVNEAFHAIPSSTPPQGTNGSHQHETNITSNEHTEENSEVTTKKNCEKICDGTSEQIVSSNDQNQAGETGLLLQNGLPPSNIPNNKENKDPSESGIETNKEEKMDISQEKNDNGLTSHEKADEIMDATKDKENHGLTSQDKVEEKNDVTKEEGHESNSDSLDKKKNEIDNIPSKVDRAEKVFVKSEDTLQDKDEEKVVDVSKNDIAEELPSKADHDEDVRTLENSPEDARKSNEVASEKEREPETISSKQERQSNETEDHEGQQIEQPKKEIEISNQTVDKLVETKSENAELDPKSEEILETIKQEDETPVSLAEAQSDNISDLEPQEETSRVERITENEPASEAKESTERSETVTELIEANPTNTTESES